MSTLVLRLAAPLQAWGVGSKFDTRATEREPSKSGVLGLLASALGIRRDEDEKLQALSLLRFGVLVEKEGKLLHDFHMVHGEKSSYVTHRYYLSDAVFLCGLEGQDDALLQQYEAAFTHPVHPLFLGRRSCPPTLPLVLGIYTTDLETALRTALAEELAKQPTPKSTKDPRPDAFRLLLDADSAEQKNVHIVKDVPVSFNPHRREFGYRMCCEQIIQNPEV